MLEMQQLQKLLEKAEQEIEQLRSERASINTMLDTELTRRLDQTDWPPILTHGSIHRFKNHTPPPDAK
jgi:hypothetical protein